MYFAMNPNWIVFILKYYSIFGFYNKSCAKFHEKCVNSLILFVHVGLCSWCSLTAMTSFVEEIQLMEFLDALNFLLYYLTSAATYCLIIVDSYANRNNQRSFWKLFAQIDGKYCHQFNKWSYLSGLITLSIGNTAMSIIAFAYERTTGSDTKIMNCIFLNVFDHRIFFYLLHMEAITFQLQKINAVLKNISLNKHLDIRRPAINSLTKLQCKWIRTNYRYVHEMTNHMNSMFGWSNLALTLLSFLSSITFLNFIYRQCHRKFGKFDSGLCVIY